MPFLQQIRTHTTELSHEGSKTSWTCFYYYYMLTLIQSPINVPSTRNKKGYKVSCTPATLEHLLNRWPYSWEAKHGLTRSLPSCRSPRAPAVSGQPIVQLLVSPCLSSTHCQLPPLFRAASTLFWLFFNALKVRSSSPLPSASLPSRIHWPPANCCLICQPVWPMSGIV